MKGRRRAVSCTLRREDVFVIIQSPQNRICDTTSRLLRHSSPTAPREARSLEDCIAKETKEKDFVNPLSFKP